MLKKKKLILVFLFLIGFLLRVWQVGKYPPLLWDEAALGYNAYSILKTGRDEHGKILPLIFKSFGDYKPGFYVYLTIPFVALFGLSELAVRLPSVILGSLTPIFLYFLVREMLKKEKLAFLSALILTFLPWQIHFSRGGWETNVLVFFLVLGSLLFVKKKWNWFLLPFLLGLWTYQGAKMMVPLVLLGLVVFNFELFKKNLKKINLFSFLILALMGLWYFQSFGGEAGNRLKVMSLFSYQRPESEIEMLLDEDGLDKKNLHFYLFHGEWLHFTRGGLTRYVNHFSPRFLAFEGDWSNSRHSAPYFGTIGHLNFILLFLGIFFFLSKKREFKQYFFLYWLLIAPLPAALTRDIISGVRALAMVIPIAFFISYGFLSVYRLVKLKWLRSLVLGVLIFISLIDFLYWTDLYYVAMVKGHPKEWLYGHKEVINFITDKEKDFEKVILTDFYGQPHIYYLFYTGYSPSEYQRKMVLLENEAGDVGRVENLDKISFRQASWGSDRDTKNALVILPHDEFLRGELEKKPEAVSRLIELGVINNRSMFYALENK